MNYLLEIIDDLESLVLTSAERVALLREVDRLSQSECYIVDLFDRSDFRRVSEFFSRLYDWN